MEKDKIVLCIKGNPITKKNSAQIIKVHGRTIIVPSKQYKDYEKEFMTQTMLQKCNHLDLNEPLTVICKYYMQTKRKVDLVNLLNATDDCLQAAGVIEDDESKIICSHDGSRVYYDKENPRTEITILPFKE